MLAQIQNKKYKTNGMFFHVGFISLSLLQDSTKQGFVMYPFNACNPPELKITPPD
jgi:hypothetical protein